MCSVPVHKLNESGDPPVLRAQISQLFDDWISLADAYKRDEGHDSFVARLQHLGFLKVDSACPRVVPLSYSKTYSDVREMLRLGQPHRVMT